jgi:crotonobetainyl-CoA hydratase
MGQPVKITRRGKTLEIVLDRPPANAINRATSYALYEAFKTLRDDPDLLVGIITGTGERIFSAGWDLKEVASGDELSQPDQIDLGPGGIGGLPEFWDLHKPVIAAINGACVGGGFEMALAADLIVAAEHAEFFLPEMERGFVSDAGAVQRLPRRVPYNVAMDLMLTGRRRGAQEAKHWGLVRDVVPAAQLMTRAREVADGIAQGAPLAIVALKEVMNAIAPLSIEEAFAKTKQGWIGNSGMPHFERMMKSEDYSEGPRAFAEKRKPVWKGR